MATFFTNMVKTAFFAAVLCLMACKTSFEAGHSSFPALEWHEDRYEGEYVRYTVRNYEPIELFHPFEMHPDTVYRVKDFAFQVEGNRVTWAYLADTGVSAWSDSTFQTASDATEWLFDYISLD